MITACFVLLNFSLSAQKNETIIVRAGMRVIDCFPFQERYRFLEFITGRIQLKNGIYSDTPLNLNFLSGEMEYVRSHDTLSIANKKDIRFVAIAADTFVFDNGYIEQIYGSRIKIGLKEQFRLKEIQNKDSYGISSSGSSTISYNSLPAEGNYYRLTADKDMVFQKTQEYFILSPTSGFIPITKKAVLQMFPDKEEMVKAFLKSDKINFGSRDDLIKLADFLSHL